MILNEPSITNNESINIKIQDKKKIITNENVILKSNIEEENDNEAISQNEEMIKKQRQITNYDPNLIETIKTNNSISNSYYYHKLGNCYAFFGNKSGDPLFIIGPQWPMFFALTIVLNTIVCFLLIKFWKYCTVFFIMLEDLEYSVHLFFKLLLLDVLLLIQDFQKMILEGKLEYQKKNINFVLNANFIMI